MNNNIEDVALFLAFVGGLLPPASAPHTSLPDIFNALNNPAADARPPKPAILRLEPGLYSITLTFAGGTALHGQFHASTLRNFAASIAARDVRSRTARYFLDDINATLAL